MRLLPLLAAIFFPLVASAGEVKFSPAEIEECEKQPGDPRYCIGLAMEICWAETHEGYSQENMAACGWAEAEYWQSRLDTVFAAHGNNATRDMFQRFIASWEDARSARCELFSARADETNAHQGGLAGCMIYSTAEEVLYQEQQLRGLKPKIALQPR